MKQPRWITKQIVLAIHESLVAEHGGAPGLRDEGMLDAALASPLNHFAYERVDIPRLAAAYAWALTRNHPFTDGNKRVALTVAGVFLELNGYRLEASEHDEARATRALSSRKMNEERLPTGSVHVPRNSGGRLERRRPSTRRQGRRSNRPQAAKSESRCELPS